MKLENIVDKSCGITVLHRKEIQQRDGRILLCETVRVTRPDGSSYKLIHVSDSESDVIVV